MIIDLSHKKLNCFMYTFSTTYKEPKTKWQLAVSIEEYARACKYDVWGLQANMTIHFEAFTKEELKNTYEKLKTEYNDNTRRNKQNAKYDIFQAQ